MLFVEEDLDGVEIGPVCGFFAPAALHQDSQLFTVTVETQGRAQERAPVLSHRLNDLWGDTVT